MTFYDLDQINVALDNQNGIMCVSMQDLRNAAGYDRLGRYVLNDISNGLRGRGISHYPLQLPLDQTNWVLIYRQGSPGERIVRAVLEPGPRSGDILSQAVGSDAEQVLQRIRELVSS